MRLELTATAVKSWFQYHCERKLIYDSLPLEEKRAIPIHEQLVVSPWAEFGNEFEEQVLKRLAIDLPGKVLIPPTDRDQLSDRMTLAFLARERLETFASQAVLRETPELRKMLALSNEISIRPAKPDLLRVEVVNEVPVFQVIDVKATQVATVFHKAQVALYSLMLRCLLRERGLKSDVALVGQIWHLPPTGSNEAWHKLDFPVRGYEALVIDFFKNQLPRIARSTVERGRDNSFFHIYFKCEQCKYLEHCGGSISEALPREQWDVSAVPGLSHEAKRTLIQMGVSTVGALAQAQGLRASLASSGPWALRARGDRLVARSNAIVTSQCQRLPNRFTWLMPERVDVAIYLVADRSPIDGDLVALGCLISGPNRNEATVKVVRRSGDELAALVSVLGRVVEVLTDIDTWNRGHSEQEALFAHLFVYEPSEAVDLQDALGRHIDNPRIRLGLVHFIRMFPPEQVTAPEPEYRGVHHLPATALRSVLEELYAIPSRVSYDLASVTAALTAAKPPLLEPYKPTIEFARPFSSRLSIDVSSAIRRGARLEKQIEQDVILRLRATKAVADWIIDDNRRAAVRFLRLKKKPFRFQTDFHPLAATDLDVLMAHELLENRAALLSNLTELARPAEERRDRLRCFANLNLMNTHPAGASYRMRFRIPKESRQAELSGADLGLILTNDDPDLRLNPQFWPSCSVRIREDGELGPFLNVDVFRPVYEGPVFEDLRRTTSQDGWFLDAVHVDYNTDRVVNFLRSLSEVSG